VWGIHNRGHWYLAHILIWQAKESLDMSRLIGTWHIYLYGRQKKAGTCPGLLVEVNMFTSKGTGAVDPGASGGGSRYLDPVDR